MDKNELLADIERFLSQTGMGECAFGARAVNQGHLVARMRAGGDIGMTTASRIRDFLNDQRASMDNRGRIKSEQVPNGASR